MWDIIFSTSFLMDFLVSTLRMSTPLAYAGLSCVIAERSGIFNIGAEGMILGGAFAAAVGALFTESAWLGVGLACIVGMSMGLLLAVLSIQLGANQKILAVKAPLGRVEQLLISML